MTTRSRRSGASGEAPALNPTMIHLLDTGRLKKELELRGLATTGSKTMLADRLAEAVVLGKIYDEAVNTPVSPVKTRAPRKKSIVAPVAVKSEPNISSADDSLVEVHSSRRTLTKAKQSRRKSVQTKKCVFSIVLFNKFLRNEMNLNYMLIDDCFMSSNLNPSSAKRRKISASCIKEEVVSTESDEDAPLSKVISKKPELRKESSTDNQLFASPTVDQVSSVSMTVAPELGRNLSDEDEDVPLLKTQHHHGTRSKKRAEILVDSVPVVRKRAFEETNILRNTDFSVDIPSPSNMTPCGSGPSSPSKLKTDYERKAEKVMKREKRTSASEKDRPATLLERRSSTATEKSRTRVTERKTITDLWAEKLAEVAKEKSSQIAEIVVKLESGEETDGKTTKSPETSRKLDERKATVLAKKMSIKADTDDLLGSILVDQSELLKNTKKNMEDEEMLERELAEQRRGQLTTIRSNLYKLFRFFRFLRTIPIALPVPPPPPPKRTVLEPQLISSRSPISTLPPPPPPPKLNAMSVPRPNPKMLVPSSTRSAPGRSLPPPPPRGPKPVRVVLEAENYLDYFSNVLIKIFRNVALNIILVREAGKDHQGRKINFSLLLPTTFNIVYHFIKYVTAVEREVRECVDVLITLVENIQPHNYELNEDSSSFDVVQLEKADEPQIDTEMLKTGPEDQKEEEEVCNHYEYGSLIWLYFLRYLFRSMIPWMLPLFAILRNTFHQLLVQGIAQLISQVTFNLIVLKKCIKNLILRDVADLLKDPRHLLARATVVLQSLNNPQPTSISPSSSTHQLQYSQVVPEEEYEPEETEKPMPEFHGEPVPSDDDDMLFEIAAGLTKPKKKKEVVIEEERLPSDETIEPDYCRYYFYSTLGIHVIHELFSLVVL
uniref:SAP domain-containing protein n=1 Tax=Heterorhabditis bacteriophora TaxID=37862 RepID=A0A1I7W9T0_HETBA